MKKLPSSKLRSFSPILLILGMGFFAIGLAFDQNLFTWIAIVLLVAALVTSGRWLGRR